MAKATGSQHRQCQHFGESTSLLWECFGRQHLLAKSFKGPSPVRLHSRSAPVQGYESTGDWMTQEERKSSKHLVTVAHKAPDKSHDPSPPPRSSDYLTHSISFKLSGFLHFFFCFCFKKLFHFHSRSVSPACLLMEFHLLPGQEENVMHRGNSNCYYENLLDKGKRKRWQQHAA